MRPAQCQHVILLQRFIRPRKDHSFFFSDHRQHCCAGGSAQIQIRQRPSDHRTSRAERHRHKIAESGQKMMHLFEPLIPIVIIQIALS